MTTAERPDYGSYSDPASIDGMSTGGGSLFGEYPSVQLDAVLGVPILIEDAVIRESTINPGDYYAVIAAVLTRRKMLTPKAEGEEPYQGEIGYLISAATSSFRVVSLVRQMIERGFAKPYAVMVSKVEGGHPRARTLVPAKIDNAAEVAAARAAKPPHTPRAE